MADIRGPVYVPPKQPKPVPFKLIPNSDVRSGMAAPAQNTLTTKPTKAQIAASAAAQARVAAGLASLARYGANAASSTSPSQTAAPGATPSVIQHTGSASSGSGGGATSSGGVTSGTAQQTADTGSAQPDLYSQIYSPLEQSLKDQAAANENRYAQNKADIASLTGVLTQIAPLDRQRINDQFAASIQQQKTDVAARTAEARANQSAETAGAATAGGELGSGGMPVPTSSWSGAATDQGIAQSNANQANWAGFMGAMQQQQLGNVDARQAGYGFEIANALQNLARGRQNQITQQDTAWNQLLSQEAQGKLSAQAAQAQLANDRAVAQIKAQGTMGAAQIRAQGASSAAGTAANARITAAEIAAGAKGKSASNSTVRDWERSMRQGGMSGADLTRLKDSVKNIETRIVKRHSVKDASGVVTKVGKATPQDVYSAWLKENGKASSAYKDAVAQAIKQGYYKYF